MMTSKYPGIPMRRHLTAVALVTLLSACGGGGGGGGGSTPAAPATPATPAAPVAATITSTTTAIRAFTADTKTIPVTVLDAGGAVIAGATVLWTSSAPTVASVDATGKVTALAVGTATITATSGSASLSIVIGVDVTPATVPGLLFAYPYVATSTTVPGLTIRSDVSAAFSSSRLPNLETTWRYLSTYFGITPTLHDFNYTVDHALHLNHTKRLLDPSGVLQEDELQYYPSSPAEHSGRFMYVISPLTPAEFHWPLQQHHATVHFMRNVQADSWNYAFWLLEGLGRYFRSGTMESATKFTFTRPEQSLIDLYKAKQGPADYISLSALFAMDWLQVKDESKGAYATAAMLASYLQAHHPTVVPNIVAQMKAGTIIDRAGLENALLTGTGVASLAVLENAYRTWALAF